jgi:hypothetical protein
MNTVKQSTERIVAVGREKLVLARRARARESLLTELGQVCFEDRAGTAMGDTDTEINRLVAKLMLLDEPANWSDDLEGAES